MVYRRAELEEPIQPLEDEGIVGELVQQFADPLAFYRELIQNAIDAGSSEISVRLLHGGEGLMRITVRDEGEGMSASVIEDRLLVLFRSGKEGQSDKIGKFGVGFVSVLALRPSRVVVQTSQGEGKALTLHLYPDHRYELFESRTSRGPGTSVTLEVQMPRDEVEAFTERSHVALLRWCRHAQVPIHLMAQVEGADAELISARIDEPLGLPNVLVSVEHKQGPTRVVVGLPPEDALPYAGFFNQGLLLHETKEAFGGALASVHFKVQDPRLEHTLSRDNVRRDKAFRAALDIVERCVKRHLPTTVLRELKGAALQEDGRYVAILGRGLELVHSEAIWVPLLEPYQQKRVIRVGDASRWAAAKYRSELTSFLASEGFAIADLSRMGSSVGGQSKLLRLLDVVPAHQSYTLIRPVETTPSDLAMLDAMLRRLEKAHRRPSGAQLVQLMGASSSHAYYGAAVETKVRAITKLSEDPFRLVARPGLLLNVEDAVVRAARKAAQDDPTLAGSIAARDVLLHFEALDEKRDYLLTQDALSAVGIGG